jgi:hypothetical protein
MQLIIFLPTFNAPCMRRNIRYDRWKRKYFGLGWEVNKALNHKNPLLPSVPSLRFPPPLLSLKRYNIDCLRATHRCQGLSRSGADPMWIEALQATPPIGTPPSTTLANPSLCGISRRGLDGVSGVDVTYIPYSGGSVVGEGARGTCS